MISVLDEFNLPDDDDTLSYANGLLKGRDICNNFANIAVGDDESDRADFIEHPMHGLQYSALADVSVDIEELLKQNSNVNEDQNAATFCDLSDVFASTDASNQIANISAENLDSISGQQGVEDEFGAFLNCDLLEEVVVSDDHGSDGHEQANFEIGADLQIAVDGGMTVKEQPKADQRARYASDGARFLPDSKKHPVTIELPDLSLVSCQTSGTFGVVLTMVTSANNPKKHTFVHVNGLKYRTNDAIELGDGGVFLPLTESDIEMRQKSFPRLSIICKKYDDYTFNLTPFDTATCERTTEIYEVSSGNNIGIAAKGKQFTVDYDLLSYKIVFQLAVKLDAGICILDVKCETDLVNEQRTPTKGVKRSAASTDETPAKRKDNAKTPAIGKANRRLKRFKRSSMDS